MCVFPKQSRSKMYSFFLYYHPCLGTGSKEIFIKKERKKARVFSPFVFQRGRWGPGRGGSEFFLLTPSQTCNADNKLLYETIKKLTPRLRGPPYPSRGGVLGLINNSSIMYAALRGIQGRFKGAKRYSLTFILYRFKRGSM